MAESSVDAGEPTLTSRIGEIPACPVCGSEGGGIVVGRQARFEEPVRNVCCSACSTVYQSPRPAPETMAEYLKTQHRQLAANVGYLTEYGTVTADDAQYQEIRSQYYAQRAHNAILLTQAQVGDRILEIGCDTGETLAVQRQLLDASPQAVAFDARDAERVSDDGIPCFAGELESFSGENQFDVVQMFHVLQRSYDPLGMLMRARELLTDAGQLVIEVPNIYQPYGLLEENFFQGVNLVSFSPSTLPALLRRAGFIVDRVVDGNTLFVVARRDARADALPKAFDCKLLQVPDHDASWVATRLGTYAALERIRHGIINEGPNMDLVHGLVHQLMRPAFESHMAHVIADIVEFFMGHRAVGLAHLVATAASEGPYHPEIKEGLAALASAVKRSTRESEERPDTTLLDATRADEINAHRDRFQKAVEAVRCKTGEPSLFFIPVNLDGSLPTKRTGPQA